MLTEANSDTPAVDRKDDAAAMTKRAGAEAVRVSGFAALVKEHIGIVVTSVASFLLFSGNSYYTTLLEGFGLHRGLLQIGQSEAATIGFLSVVFAFFELIRTYWLRGVGIMAAGFVIGGSVVYAMRRYPHFKRLIQPVLDVGEQIDRVNSTILKVFSVLGVVLVGLGAGSAAGTHDVKAFSAQRKVAKRCYYVDGVAYRGVVLVQDAVRTVLLHPDRTSLISNDRLSMIQDCPQVRRARSKK